MPCPDRNQNSHPLQRRAFRPSNGPATPLSPPPSPIQHGVQNPRQPRTNQRSAAGSNLLCARGVQFPLPKVAAKPSTARKRALLQQSVLSASPKEKTRLQALSAKRHTPRATESASHLGEPSRSCAEPCGTTPATEGVGYRKPLDASAALDSLRTGETTAGCRASFTAYAADSGQCLSWTRSPTFPFLEYASEPDIPPTYSAIDASYRTNEVYALPPSQHLFSTNPTTRCGNCFKTLRWGSVLPSRCQQPSCHVLNVGNDWAANEKFRQAQFRERAITRQEQGSRNYLGEGIRYEALIKWKEGGGRRSEDPVHWQDFMQCHALQDWAAQEKDRDQGEVDMRNWKGSGTSKMDISPDALPVSQLRQPSPASNHLHIDPLNPAQDGEPIDLAVGRPDSENAAAPAVHNSHANGSADFLTNAVAEINVFDFSNLLDVGDDFLGDEALLPGRHALEQQQQQGEESGHAQSDEGNDATPAESFTDLLYNDTNLSFFDLTSPARRTPKDTSNSPLKDKTWSRITSELLRSEPGLNNPPFNKCSEHHPYVLPHTPSSSSDPFLNEHHPTITNSAPPPNLEAKPNSNAGLLVRSNGTAELLPPIISSSNSNPHRGISTGCDMRRPAKRPFSISGPNQNPLQTANPSLILRRDCNAEFVRSRSSADMNEVARPRTKRRIIADDDHDDDAAAAAGTGQLQQRKRRCL